MSYEEEDTCHMRRRNAQHHVCFLPKSEWPSKFST